MTTIRNLLNIIEDAERLEESLTILETTERLDVREVRNWTPQQWNQWLDNQIQNGEVYKADWTDAKQAISRQIDRAGEVSRNIYLDLDNAAREPYSDLYWDVPHGLTELNKAEKTAAKSPDGPFKKSVLELVATYKPLKDKLEQLKPLIVTAVQQRDIKKTQQAEKKRAEEGSAEALINALQENRQGYIDHAVELASKKIAKMKRWLQEAGGVAAFPEPGRELRKQDPKAYEDAINKLNYVRWLSNITEERYIEMALRGAEENYDAWTYKLVQKIGKPVVAAEVTGDPWTQSVIEVETSDGEHQAWATQQIINTSKLGKQFYQFPTRRIR